MPAGANAGLREKGEELSFPNFKNKQEHDSIVNPQDFLEYLERVGRRVQFDPPGGVILSYQRGLVQYVLENHETTSVALGGAELYLLDETDQQVAIAGRFGIGAPAAAIILETFIASGIPRFVSIGTAGSLQKSVNIGDIVVCDRAIRDEGTSHHYLEPSVFSYASAELTERAKRSLDKIQTPYTVGTSWTVDAPFRETVAEVTKYQEEGILTVEMEAAALFTVAEYRNVQLAAILTVSDTLADLTWNPQFHHPKTQEGLETLYRVAVDALV